MADAVLDPLALQPYLPRLVSDWLVDTPHLCRQEREGSVVFVDISGFTKLSERLARHGKVGAEEVTDAIGSCFSRLLDVSYAWGGGLLKFGGDALLLLFEGDDHQLVAVQAAIGMRRTLSRVGDLRTSGGRVKLRMSVGIHSGAFHFFLVGGSHRELLITGPAASQTVLMESTAEAGEIVVSPDTAAALPKSVLGEPKGPGILLRRAPTTGIPNPQRRRDYPDPRTLLHAVPVGLREHLVAGVEPEHRPVTVAFVHYDGTDGLIGLGGSEMAAESLDTLIRTVQAAVEEHDVAFLASDVDRDGGKIILTSGAPRVTGQDEERMLLAIRQILNSDLILPVRVGVNRGHVFAGEIGSAYRRTYTVMGDAVNLAARVMAKAVPGQLLATQNVLDHSRLIFVTTPLPPFEVKGKSEPVQASVVGGVCGSRDVGTSHTPFVGRDLELAMLGDLTGLTRSGSGAIVEVVGEAGIGKSRLVAELRMRADDVRAVAVTCERYESTTPYAAVGSIFRQVLDLPPATDAKTTEARLREVVEQSAPELAGWIPLLGIPLGLDLPPTPQTRDIEQRFLRPRLADVLGRLLARLLDRAALIAVEDSHWMDEASADLLRHLAPTIATSPWLLCVIRRDVEGGFEAPEGTVRLRLEPLDEAQAQKLVIAATTEAPIPPHQVDALVARSGGNPMFLEELVAAVTGVENGEGLPDSVETLLMARVDRLGPQVSTVLRRLAVLGTSADWELVPVVLEDEGDEDPPWDQLAEFLDIVPGEKVRFRRTLLRDVAYEGLPFVQRRELHGRVGDLIERSADGSADDQAVLLSFHYFHAQRHPQAWRYSLVAADRAHAIYANVEAAQFYERAIESGRRIRGLPQSDLARVYEKLGDVRDRMGTFSDAAEAYRTARRFLADDPVIAARLMLKVAWERGWLGSYSEALRWITRALGLVRNLSTVHAARQRAQLMVWYGRFRQEQGRHQEAIDWCWRAIEEAQASGEKDALAHAFKLLDWAYTDLGASDRAVHSTKALQLFEELGNLREQSAVLNNMGGLAYWQGRWDEALELYQRAQDVADRVGDALVVYSAKGNIGEILADQSRIDEAEAIFREVLRAWQAAGHRAAAAYVKRDLGKVALRSGRHEDAMRIYLEVRHVMEDVGAKVEVVETDARIAECHLFLANPDAALETATAALDLANDLGGVAAQTPYLHRIRGYAFMQLGSFTSAREALNASLSDGRARNADYEVALTLQALAMLNRAEGRSDSEALMAESRAILDRLGVIRTYLPLQPSDGSRLVAVP